MLQKITSVEPFYVFLYYAIPCSCSKFYILQMEVRFRGLVGKKAVRASGLGGSSGVE
ncbi:MAG: hypothetical protein MR004_09340 [Clostridiales bacterium]|nr:hypothetical protein [bacterium 210917-SL.2.15]MCI5843829.1 hypothetical protein [Clostridiales bacterium]MDY4035772.1 hypothetical protein [Candidatus Pseudoscilispira sp.]